MTGTDTSYFQSSIEAPDWGQELKKALRMPVWAKPELVPDFMALKIW